MGAQVLGGDPEALHLELQEHLAPARRRGEHGPVVAERGRGCPVQVDRGAKDVDHVGGLGGGEGARGQEQPRVVVDMLRISASSPPASRQWVMSACHISLGGSASKRISEERGRLWGWGTTSPSRLRIRQIVETEGTESSSVARW